MCILTYPKYLFLIKKQNKEYKMKKSEISIQLYTARKFHPYEEIFKFFSDSGIKNIELFGIDNFNAI